METKEYLGDDQIVTLKRQRDMLVEANGDLNTQIEEVDLQVNKLIDLYCKLKKKNFLKNKEEFLSQVEANNASIEALSVTIENGYVTRKTQDKQEGEEHGGE